MNRNIPAPFLLISLLSLLIFVLLFIFRAADDNRLTSWQWVFNGVNPALVYIILCAGIGMSLLLRGITVSPRYFAQGLFLMAFVSAALFWGVPEAIVDASRYFTQAKHLKIYGSGYFFREWGHAIQSWTDLPLMPFLYGVIFRFLGESRLYIQVFTAVLFSMSIVFTYLIGKELWDEETGLLGGALLLGMPYLFSQVPLMLVDVPTMFFLTLSVFTFIRAMGRGGAWILFSSIAIFLAFYSKYSAWLMLSVLIVIFVVYLQIPSCPPLLKGGRRGLLIPDSKLQTPNLINSELNPPPFPSPSRGEGKGEEIPLVKGGGNIVPLPSREGLGEERRTILFRGALIVSIAALLIGIVFWYKFDVFSEQIKLLLSYQKPGLRRWEESFVSTFFFQIHPFITAFAVYSAYAAFKKRDIKYAVISCLIILILLLQIKRIRYIIMAFPMLTLMASYGLQEIRDKDIRKFIVLCIVISSLTIGIFAYLPFLQKISTVNLKHAGEFLDSINEKNIEVFVMPQKKSGINPAVSVPILDLFTKKRITYHYDKGLYPLPEDFEKSPLRFTWEYMNPEYYTAESENEKKALLLIVNDVEQKLPAYIEQRIKGYSRSKVFKTWEGVFSYKTVVVVYYN